MYKFTVCVADDCVDETTVLCEGLKLNNYTAIPAYNGEDALRACQAGGVDLLLLDIGLPDIHGHEVCKQLKANPETADIPIIFITAKGAGDDVSKGFDLGAVDYIVKPYNLPMVMVCVDSAMRTRQLTGNLGTDPEFLHDPVYTDTLTGLKNRRFLLERLEEEVEKAHRYDYPVSCLFVGLDEVEALDQEAGAAALDDVLVEIAMAIRNASRNYDILARFDSGLFAAVLPHALLQDAVAYAKKISEEINTTTFSSPSFPTQASLCFGIVSCRNGSARGAEQVLGQAMRNLLCATAQPEKRIVARDLSESGESDPAN